MEQYIARQPIFDIDKKGVAYELLFRDGGVNALAATRLPDMGWEFDMSTLRSAGLAYEELSEEDA